MSGRRGELCEGVEASRLVAGMRELRGRTGLSLAALSARTPYSKSSWERYLNGKKLPPRGAVEALCRLAGEPAGRLVALWELADAAWSRRAAPSVRAEPAAPPVPSLPPVPSVPPVLSAPPGPSVRPPFSRAVAAVAAGVCVGVLAVGAALAFWAGEGRVSGPAQRAVPSASAVTGCRGRACDGKDPQSMFCAGAGLVETPVERIATRGQHLQVRYGTVCGAAWGRLRNGRVGDRIEVWVPGSAPRSVRVRDRFDAEEYLVTPMAAARGPQGIRLCLYPVGGAAKECFPG
ncbi:helix-turn-helix domain-containing protein [Streptomyces lydicus]|uniref:helix-turn-helix domain-containing protein n=1 Tax=Streptomyces lydicus TaxID=47763 RepID=UPI0037D2DDC0